MVSWSLVVISFLTISMGYSLSRGWITDQFLASFLHRVCELFFLGFLATHVVFSFNTSRLDWTTIIRTLKERRGTEVQSLRLVQKVSSWLIVIFAFLMIIPGLNGYEIFAQSLEDVVPFELHRIFDVFLVSFIAIHVAMGVRFFLMRRRIGSRISNLVVASLIIALLSVTIILDVGDSIVAQDTTYPDYVRLFDESVGFNPSEIESIRPDIFKPGSFSMFDILVHLHSQGAIDLEYHFDESMNTHVIDSLDGREAVWYVARYSGGWFEENVFRMDHYPWKDGGKLFIKQLSVDRLNAIYNEFREEVLRLEYNKGAVVIPEVTITGQNFAELFTNVIVTPHNLRNDTFQDGIVTAIDVIFSLSDQGLINHELMWYERISGASIVRSYWVEAINNETSVGTCGWVYESGSELFPGATGNHIHIPSDTRVLNSPEYSKWFWICI